MIDAELSHLFPERSRRASCCEIEHLPDLANGMWDGLEPLVLDMLKRLYDGNGVLKTVIDPALTAWFAETLWQGVQKGYNFTPAYNIADDEMLLALQKNTWQFAAAKNYHELRKLGRIMLSDEGKLRSFHDFKHEALKENQAIVGYQLRAEYNLAVAGSQNARKWKDVQDLRSEFPFVAFDVVSDKQTSDICRDLRGVIVPVGHPLLQTHYPPNHFGCRTTIRQLRRGSATPDKQITPPDIPPMFRTNLAQTGLIFPENHPFFKELPNSVYQEVQKRMPYNHHFTQVQYYEDTQGSIRQQHGLKTTTDDYPSVLSVATDKAKAGARVDMLTPLELDDPTRMIIYYDAFANKNPDLRIDGILHDVKRSKLSANTLKNSIGEAAHQTENVILFLNENISEKDFPMLEKVVRLKRKDYPQLKTIQFRSADGVYYTY